MPPLPLDEDAPELDELLDEEELLEEDDELDDDEEEEEELELLLDDELELTVPTERVAAELVAFGFTPLDTTQRN